MIVINVNGLPVASIKDRETAESVYSILVEASEDGRGDAGGQIITMLVDGLPHKEYLPSSLVGDGEVCFQEVLNA